jgi:ribose transport system substrate-binding protein
VKKTLILVLMLCVVAGAFAQGFKSQSQPPFVGDKNEVYYFVSWNAGNVWWAGGYEGFKDAARQLGVQTVCAGSPDDSIEHQTNAFEQVVNLKPAGVCLAVSDGSSFGNVVQKAIASGIPVATTDNKIAGANAIMFMGYDDNGMTKNVADYIGKTLGGKGTVAMLEVVGQKNLEERAASFRANLKAYWPKIQVVASANSGHDELKGASDTASLLITYPDLDFIYTLNPTAAMGAATAIQEAKSKCRIITMDVNENVLDYIKKGKIDACMMPDSYSFGYLSMMALFVERHKLMDPMWVVDGVNKSGWCVPYLQVGSTVINKTNADNYYLTNYLKRRSSKGFDEGAQNMTSPKLKGYWKR